MCMTEIRRIVIGQYRSGWEDEFASIERALRVALGSLALRIDHIGSTAVPGLPAKDIIDVQVTVVEFTSELEAAFLKIGYPRRTDITRDHQPPGASGEERDWEKQYYQPTPDLRLAHVHVRRAGSPNGRYALLFRDYLRAHPGAAEAYARVKKALAAHDSTNWDLYYDVKDPVCDIIMAGAEEWAAAVGWRVEHYT
jgi:GrpB-like predicted nucleotidyltransferase (UPF0157 family)